MKQAWPVEDIFLTPALWLGDLRATSAELASLTANLSVCLIVLTPRKLLGVQRSNLARLIITL